MNLRIPAMIAAAAAILTFSSCASAQFDPVDKSPLGLSVGMFRPSGQELNDIGSSWFGVNLAWNMKFDDLGRPTSTLSVGWFNQDTSGANARMVPFRYSYIRRFGDEDSCWYLSGGLDVMFLHYQRYEYNSSTFSSGWVGDNGTALGYNMAVGREFGGGWFVEARQDIVGKLSHKTGGEIDFSGWTFSVGSRLGY